MASKRAQGLGQGASQGAMVGSAFGGWGALIGGVVGGISGYFGGISARKAEREQERAEEKIHNVLSVKKFRKKYGQFLPYSRQEIAAGQGPRIRQALEGRVAGTGMQDTGLGTALQGLAKVAPEVEASRLAAERAQMWQVNRAKSLGA